METRFDPDAAAAPGSGLFGLSDEARSSAVHVLCLPFDATTSYRRGVARGPAAVLRASHQVELFDPLFGRPYEAGIHLLATDPRVERWNEEAAALAEPVIAAGGAAEGDATLLAGAARVDELGERLNELARERTGALLDERRLPVVLGGDHSVPLGAMQAAAERHPGLGILHFDAHADLRVAFEGFRYSHASILHNVLERAPEVARLVQVGVRDLGGREAERIEADERIETLFDLEWAGARMAGQDLSELARRTIERLPREVWVTFDVDGLDPALCPGTGTPVPGGLSWAEAMLWLDLLARSGRRVVGVDLCEVAPGATPGGQDSWDAIVGARLLYRLIGCALATR